MDDMNEHDPFDEFAGEEVEAEGEPMVFVDTHLVFRAIDESGMEGTTAFVFMKTLERLMNDPEACARVEGEGLPMDAPEGNTH